MELIFIGTEFYHESKTAMSFIYTVDGKRSDWGFVQIALREGKSVHIRPATEKELEFYRMHLRAIKARWEMEVQNECD